MKRAILFVVVSIVICCATGCFQDGKALDVTGTRGLPVMYASYTASPLLVDGILDEDVWKKTAVYNMDLADDSSAGGKVVEEGGQIRLAWDDEYFYVGISFEDSDIAAEGQADQIRHYDFGDVAELFLKPANHTWYWELYVTPLSMKSSYCYPGRGRLGLSRGVEDYKCGLKVAAQYIGTCNNWQDKDKSWTAEMAMPIRDLTARGETFGPQSDWRILVARYNYSRYLKEIELSMTPRLSKTLYHSLEEYAVLRLME